MSSALIKNQLKDGPRVNCNFIQQHNVSAHTSSDLRIKLASV